MRRQKRLTTVQETHTQPRSDDYDDSQKSCHSVYRISSTRFVYRRSRCPRPPTSRSQVALNVVLELGVIEEVVINGCFASFVVDAWTWSKIFPISVVVTTYLTVVTNRAACLTLLPNTSSYPVCMSSVVDKSQIFQAEHCCGKLIDVRTYTSCFFCRQFICSGTLPQW